MFALPVHELFSIVTHDTPARQHTGTRLRWYTETTLEEQGYHREFWVRIVAREQTLVASVLLHYRGVQRRRFGQTVWLPPLAPRGVDCFESDDSVWHEEGGN